MSNNVDDLRATSESISADAGRLQRLESEKRALDPTDPKVAALSRDIEAIAATLAAKADAERAISDEIQGDQGA
ncbi:MAG: hypothetical protein HYX57_03085 [Chloroflexi bacterium]|nr:hypothetical protein [Chloroflexota bacterium]